MIWAVIRAYFRFCGWVGQAIFLAAIASIVDMFLLAVALDWVVAGLNLAERALVESRPTDWVFGSLFGLMEMGGSAPWVVVGTDNLLVAILIGLFSGRMMPPAGFLLFLGVAGDGG